jgi:hypothetical protein
MLHCYRRSELQRAAEYIISEDIAFTPGIGFYEIHSLEHLRNSFVEWLGQKTARPGAIEGNDSGYPLPLPLVIQESRSHWPILASCEDTTIEALISLWPEVHISRSSIFEATIAISDGKEIPLPQVESAPTRLARTQRTSAKKRSMRKTSQPDLWN